MTPCDTNRRDFLRRTAATAAAIASPTLLHAQDAEKAQKAEPAPAAPKSETLVKTLYDSLTQEQRETLTFPFDHGLRKAVDNNWHITKPQIGQYLNADQNAMVREIFLNLHSEEYRDEVIGQVAHDSGKKGFGASSIAIFGEPGSGKSEFVLTGRHCTRRADGDSVAGKAFGGPIFYGHAAKSFNEPADHAGNVYWYQAKRANEVYQMLDGKQREKALVDGIRPERGNSTVRLAVDKEIPGLPVAEMTDDQKNGVRQILADLLMPFRAEDVAESMKLIEKAGFDKLHLRFAKKGDIGDDGVWDNWMLEGPHMVWLFRGAPHVHTWVHIADPDGPSDRDRRA